MKVGKPKSKRVPVRLRHKIEKASAAKQRKMRKEAKNNPQWRSRTKKDPGIPNLFPFKDKILAEIEEKKRLKAEEQERRKEEARSRRAQLTAGDAVGEADTVDDEIVSMDGMEGGGESEDGDDSNPMAALLASARARAAEYEAEHGDDDLDEMDEDESEQDEQDHMGTDGVTPGVRKDSSRKAFDKVFKQVVDAADVILYVLDARDPEGTRSKEVERMVMATQGGEKRLILILNKIDLIPAQVLKAWLTHLRRYFPTLPLRASTPAPNARTFDHKQLTVKSTSETLFRALKTYAHNKQMKRSISVGVIGYPNVGKSSVINALTSRLGKGANVPVGAEAGVTTSLREVKIDNKLKLLDSPGIVFPSSSSLDPSADRADEQARLILLNAVPPKEIGDPVPAVTLLLKRLSASEAQFSKLLEVYGLPPLMGVGGDLTTDFLVQVARKRGRLGKGGVPNLYSAAQTVIMDWRDGRIQGWMDAPTLQIATDVVMGSGDDKTKEPVGDQKEIVKEWAVEFKLDGLWGDDVAQEGEAMEV